MPTVTQKQIRQGPPSKAEKKMRERFESRQLGKMEITTDATGKVALSRVHAYDASKKRRIAKSKKVRVKRP